GAWEFPLGKESSGHIIRARAVSSGQRRPALAGVAGIELARADRHDEAVLLRWQGTVVVRRERADRVVGPVEVEQVAIAGGRERPRVQVPAHRVRLVAGGRGAEEA